MNRTELEEQINRHWPGQARCHFAATGFRCEVNCERTALPDLCGRLFLEWGFSFAGLMVEEGANEWQLRYCFFDDGEAGWVHVLVTAPLDQTLFPSIVKFVHGRSGTSGRPRTCLVSALKVIRDSAISSFILSTFDLSVAENDR
jgi:hypothetical protein